MKKLKNLFLKFIHKTWSEKITYVVYFMFFVFMSLVFLYPIYSAILTSITDVGNTIRGEGARFIDYFIVKGKPQGETWAGVIESFSVMTDAGDQNLLAMLFNSIWFTVAKVSLSLLASTVLAYAVAKYNFPGKRLIYLLAIFVQTIPIFGTGAASIKLFIGLNMMNNPLLFWIAWITGFDFTFIIMHGAFTGISNSYSESARIDGANNWIILFKIIFPMVAPILLALFISNSLGVWNDYSTIMVYLRDYPTLSYGLYAFQNGGATYVRNATAVQAAATLVSAVPIIIIYSCSQKLILTNISVGGLKG
ncbi:MAG: carbohydrate ABC transporter permease [Bacilli bacterium]|nr:carbohydrate ABC transporter permease [Bacilli bacterium]